VGKKFKKYSYRCRTRAYNPNSEYGKGKISGWLMVKEKPE